MQNLLANNVDPDQTPQNGAYRKAKSTALDPLYTGGIFLIMLDESTCHFRGVGSILSFSFYFDAKPVRKQ